MTSTKTCILSFGLLIGPRTLGSDRYLNVPYLPPTALMLLHDLLDVTLVHMIVTSCDPKCGK